MQSLISFSQEELESRFSFDEVTKGIEKIMEDAEQVLEDVRPEMLQKAEGPILINFVTDAEIQELNAAHRAKDKPTDVLSWGFIDDNLKPNEAVGEVYISVDTCERQAEEKGHSKEYEILFLLTHGLLHVFGYDHNTDEEEAEMNSVAARIFN